MAVKALQPKCLDEAYDMVKKEQVDRTSNSRFKQEPYTNFDRVRATETDKECEIKALRNEVIALRKQIQTLFSLLGKNSGTSSAKNTPSPAVVCFNCGTKGHIARDCKRPKKCDICGKQGHISKFCQNARYNVVRHLNATKPTEEDQQSHVSQNDDDELKSENDFFLVSDSKSKNTGKKISKNNRKQLDEIEHWERYIAGLGKKPKHSGNTVITNGNLEKAINKPIVRGFLEGKQGKLFLDTGAEINVIDKTLLEKLQENSNEITVEPKKSSITCANGTKMSSFGVANILVKIGDVSSFQKFVIVDGLFPKVFLGIKALKHMRISIDAKSECARIGKTRIPFISGVESITSENVLQSSLRAKI